LTGKAAIIKEDAEESSPPTKLKKSATFAESSGGTFKRRKLDKDAFNTPTSSVFGSRLSPISERASNLSRVEEETDELQAVANLDFSGPTSVRPPAKQVVSLKNCIRMDYDELWRVSYSDGSMSELFLEPC